MIFFIIHAASLGYSTVGDSYAGIPEELGCISNLGRVSAMYSAVTMMKGSLSPSEILSVRAFSVDPL